MHRFTDSSRFPIRVWGLRLHGWGSSGSRGSGSRLARVSSCLECSGSGYAGLGTYGSGSGASGKGIRVWGIVGSGLRAFGFGVSLWYRVWDSFGLGI